VYFGLDIFGTDTCKGYIYINLVYTHTHGLTFFFFHPERNKTGECYFKEYQSGLIKHV